MRAENIYQTVLIVLGIVATAMFGAFFYHELFPDYKIYQNAYIQLEQFRSAYTGELPPEFHEGVKQIVLPRADKGPETIDRCITCHVALEFEHFSPTKIKRDVNGNIVYDASGKPLLVPNENDVWAKLDEKIAALTDEKVNAQLTADGKRAQVEERLAEAEKWKMLKVAHEGDQTYDMTKVLAMHPLIGKETRPFEFHPIETFGCTSCHSGNGRSLVTDRAHGPVFDAFYESEYEGPEPTFLESDPYNDPRFSQVFNHKPTHRLLFQTTPLFVGDLIQAKCVQCHQPTSDELNHALGGLDLIQSRKGNEEENLQKSLQQDWQALKALVVIRQELQSQGYEKALKRLEELSQNAQQTPQELESSGKRYAYLQAALQHIQEKNPEKKTALLLQKIDEDLIILAGSVATAMELAEKNVSVETFLKEQTAQATPPAGILFAKAAALNFRKEAIAHSVLMQTPWKNSAVDEQTLSAMKSDIDVLTQTYQRGEELYLSQACYACHRIAGFARGGVGPDLTLEGKSYPWFVKQSIVWPQADLKTSTMPNMKLDHEELEALMTFLLAQRGESKAIADYKYQEKLKAWEGGRKLSWEQPLTSSEILDVRNAMEIFATEGCASCHRLKGFTSDVGFAIEKGDPSFDALYQERMWFERLFPEDAIGSQIVDAAEKYGDEIDQRIVPDVRKGSVLEEIERRHPQSLEALYSSFKYALRAKNHEYQDQASKEKDPAKRVEILAKLEKWRNRIHRILMMSIQEYGLGRMIGPRLNWSGVFRSDEWLMEHFWNPSLHSPRSIMPVFPFDDTKFQALVHMLDVLGQQNRNNLHEVWSHRGFNPEQAVNLLCTQCHGPFLQGNGPLVEWIYPIPKNLKNAVFLRNLTKERAIQSITHGVKGTPMPPWGEVGKDKLGKEHESVLNGEEIEQIVSWLFSDLPGERMINPSEDVLKWRYEPEDVIQELKKEGSGPKLQPTPQPPASEDPLSLLPTGEGLYAALKPVVAKAPKDPSVDELFDVVPAPISGPEESFYYIKKRYYTSENLSQGQDLFIENCSICHGKDADGTGLRAENMRDAKPRILTNLDWLDSRDDLRLLRSIKYGVPGTAMTPWGDYTSTWQRVQLVMYIRSLSQNRQEQEELAQAVYRSFNVSLMAIDRARGIHDEKLQQVERNYRKVHQERLITTGQTGAGDVPSQELMTNYQQELDLLALLQKEKQTDQIYADLGDLVKQEKELYQNVGNRLLGVFQQSPILSDYLNILNENQRFSFHDGKLSLSMPDEKKMQASVDQLVEALDKKNADLMKQKQLLSGKIPDQKDKDLLHNIEHEIATNQKVKTILLSSFAETTQLRKREKNLFEKTQESHSP